MPSDFLQGIQTGATVGNLMAQRQERMMELRSQEALRQIQERQIAQEIDQRSQIFAQKQQEDQQDTSDLMAAQSIYHEQIDSGKSPEQAQAFIDAGLAFKNPRALQKVTKARGAQQAFAPVVRDATDTQGQPVLDEQGNPVKVLQQGPHSSKLFDPNEASKRQALRKQELDIRESNVDRLSRKYAMSEVDKAEVKGIYKRIDTLTEQLDNLPEMTGIGPWKKPNPQKLLTEAKIKGLKEQARHLEDAAVESANEGKTATIPVGVKKKLRYVPGKGLVPAVNPNEASPSIDESTSGE